MKIASTYIHRSLLLTIAMLGAWITLGGHLGGLEWLFVLLCLALNEARHWFRLDRWPRAMFLVWLSAFLQLPTAYFILKLFPGFPNVLPNAPLSPDIVLPVAVVAMALPFQVFASYYNSMPRAHHLILIFALVESVLAAKAGVPNPLWFWLLVLLVVMAISLAFGATQDQVQEAILSRVKSRGVKEPNDEGPSALVKPGNLVWVAMIVPMLLMVSFVIYSLMPQQTPSREATSEADSGSAFSSLRESPERERLPFPRSDFDPEVDVPEENRERIAGLSDSVSLGGFGDILLDHTPYATAEIAANQGEIPSAFLKRPLLRLEGLSDFDGTTWSNKRTEAKVTWSPESRYDPKRRSPLLRNISSQQFERYYRDIEVRIDYLRSQSTIGSGLGLVYPGQIRGIQDISWNSAGDPGNTELTYLPSYSKVNLTTTRGVARVKALTIRASILANRFDGNLSGRGAITTASRYTQLPKHIKQTLSAEFDTSPFTEIQGEPLQLAKALEKYFKEDAGYRYSLAYRPEGESAILDFILDPEQRIGHCEYFASAMVVLLRHFGVESRLVVGFAPDALETKSKRRRTYEIANSDAHAWVEVKVVGLGWVPFDPTTSRLFEEVSPLEVMITDEVHEAGADDATDDTSSGSGVSFKDKSLDEVTKSFGDSLRASFSSLFELFKEWWGACVALLLLVAMAIYWQFRRQKAAQADEIRLKQKLEEMMEAAKPHLSSRAISLLDRLYTACAKLRIRRLDSQTPREFVNALTNSFSSELGFLSGTVEAFYVIAYADCDEPRRLALEEEILDGVAKVEAFTGGQAT